MVSLGTKLLYTKPLVEGLSKCYISTSATRLLKFTEQHDELRSTVRKIVEKDINPFVDEWEKEGIFDGHKVFKVLGKAGLLGLTRDPKYGGQGLDYSFTVAMYEEMAYRINAAGPLTGISVHADMTQPALARFGSEELKQQFLVPSIAGDYVACLGVSEPEGGSDVAAVRTTAKREGDDLIINGGKMWITNGIQADWMCLLANTSQGSPHKNKSLICVPLNLPGVQKARNISKMGNWSSDTAQIFFDNVRVPAKNIIGEEGMGFIYQMIQFGDERLVVGSTATASAQRCIDETIDFCRQRKTFGQELIQNQHIHFRLAELQCEVETVKALFYHASDKFIEGEDVTYLASVVKLKAARLLREVVDSCLQFWGGMGYSGDTLISRMYRDTRVVSIAGGADEIMLGIVCKMMGILPKAPRKDK